jgi:hypothetical protein
MQPTDGEETNLVRISNRIHITENSAVYLSGLPSTLVISLQVFKETKEANLDRKANNPRKKATIYHMIISVQPPILRHAPKSLD